MITSVDTNVFIALWNDDEELNRKAAEILETVNSQGGIVICGAVYGELLAYKRRTENFLNGFFSDNGITVDWFSGETVWRDAGNAFSKYAERRRRQKSPEPRRILTDFFIGAHAFINGYRLLTFDDKIYRAAFPELIIINAK